MTADQNSELYTPEQLLEKYKKHAYDGEVEQTIAHLYRWSDQRLIEARIDELKHLYRNRGIVKLDPGGHFGWENKGLKEEKIEIVSSKTIKARIKELEGKE